MGLAAGAVVGGNRLGEAVKFDQHGALIDGALISLGGDVAGEIAPTGSEDGRNGKLSVFLPALGSEIER